MSEIRFNFECWDRWVEVLANEDGTGILIIDKKTDDEIDFNSLLDSDKSRIKAWVDEWADHYKYMNKLEPHPCNDHFGPAYIDSINKKGD